MKNQDIAILFDQSAVVLEFKDALIFKINACRRASRTIQELTDDIADLWRENRPGE